MRTTTEAAWPASGPTTDALQEHGMDEEQANIHQADCVIVLKVAVLTAI